MWRFIEEGPMLKFPLRESPFMAADPLYRDVAIAPSIHFQQIPIRSREITEKHPYGSYMYENESFSSSKSLHNSTGTIEKPTNMDGIGSIQVQSRRSSSSSRKSCCSTSDVM